MSSTKLTTQIVQDIIFWSSGQSCEAPNQYKKTMRKMVQQIWQQKTFKSTANIIKINSMEQLKGIADGIFTKGITWTRIAAFFAYVAHVAKYLPDKVLLLIDFLQTYCNCNLSAWISWYTWDEFVALYSDDKNDSFTVILALSLAAFIFLLVSK
jgi:hypothetical protein